MNEVEDRADDGVQAELGRIEEHRVPRRAQGRDVASSISSVPGPNVREDFIKGLRSSADFQFTRAALGSRLVAGGQKDFEGSIGENDSTDIAPLQDGSFGLPEGGVSLNRKQCGTDAREG